MSKYELQKYVQHQLNNFYPDNRFLNEDKFKNSIDEALERAQYCFQHISLSAYHRDGTTYFNHLHADQYTIFLWFLSNSIWNKFEDSELSAKLFNLNKTLNGFLCMYDAKLPDIFLVVHGNGIVLGKATYSDFLVCYQGSTVGAIDGKYPKLGKGVALAPDSSIIGNCSVGNLVTIGNQSLLRNTSIDDRSLYYRHTKTGEHIVQPTETPWAQTFFNVPIL
ncbi:hypothetical protein [Paenibacillus sp. JJ-100]|uniref:hypothetical protein n=1 Tax=Paenibacillus sp. JJ-100 TaxID=2974896 RepID=UPI00232BBC71|nr:hypothetical protein [Paenibacillus sp. JJ-100]